MTMLVLVQAYTKLNIGDDLFLHTIFTRYPETDFEVNVYDNFYEQYRCFLRPYKNVKVNSKPSLVYRARRKMGMRGIDKSRLKRYDAAVYISGSIFMENPDNSDYDYSQESEVEFFSHRRIPIYFLSCNFGPYYTQEYKKRKERMFLKCTDVCFRDMYSYNLFSNLRNVRYAPDAVFTLDKMRIIKRPRTLGISVIDLSARKNLKKFTNDYKDIMLKIAGDYLFAGYEIYLYSFCEFEGDENMAEEIYRLLIQYYGVRDNVHIVRYRGRLLYFLKQFLSMENIVCTRFHSVVLTAAMQIPMLPVIYSGKVSNVISDLRLCDHVLEISNKWGDYAMNMPIDMTHIKNASESVFQKLDKLLK